MDKLESLKEDFDLTGDNGEIKKELKKIMKDIHPDTNGGEFKSEKDKNLYTTLALAIDKIDVINEKQLPAIKNAELLALTKIISEDKQEKINLNLTNNIEKRYSTIKSRHFLPKISVTAITTGISFIWLFPNIVSEHPILGKIIDFDDVRFTQIWMGTLIATAVLWIFLHKIERREKIMSSNYNTMAFQNQIFEMFINDEESYKVPAEITFTKDYFIRFLILEHNNRGFYLTRFFSRFLGYSLDLEVAQSIADVIFERAEGKGLIAKVDNRGLIDVYRYIN